MSRSSRKGAGFETLVAEYLRDATGLDIDRRVKHGMKDTGDIHGCYIDGERVVIECKNRKKMELATWVDEAKREAAEDGAAHFFVAHHRKGKGKASMGETYVTTTLEQLAKLMMED